MIKIRKLLSNDSISEISSIYAKSWKVAYSGILPQDYLENIPDDKWVKALENPERHTLVVIKDEKIIGTSSYGESRTEGLAGQGEVYSVYLLPEYIGKGYGKMLVKAVVGELNKLGYKDVFLWVLEDNIRAISFYESVGFVRTADIKELNIGGKNVREIRYKTEIKG